MTAAQIATNILMLISGVGIFLTACTMMSANIESLGGKKLKSLFDKTSKSKLAGVGVGAAVTALIQISGATAVTVIGLVNGGIMSLYQAATVIFGANIGTTVTGLIAAFGITSGGVPVATVLSAVVGVGAAVCAFAKTERAKHAGGVVTGFGLLFVGLNVMSGVASEFSELDIISNIIVTFKNPIILIFMGTALTALVQSSSVMTAVSVTAVASGLISLGQGIYLTMGANVGSCVTAVLAGVSSTRNAKRIAAINVIFNIAGVIVFTAAGAVIDYGSLFGGIVKDSPQIGLAIFHTVFNAVGVTAVLPFTNKLVEFVSLIIPEKKSTRPELALRR